MKFHIFAFFILLVKIILGSVFTKYSQDIFRASLFLMITLDGANLLISLMFIFKFLKIYRFTYCVNILLLFSDIINRILCVIVLKTEPEYDKNINKINIILLILNFVCLLPFLYKTYKDCKTVETDYTITI